MSNPASTGSTFSRIKTWVKEKLTYQALNAEFNNILDNLDPLGVGGMSATAGDMRLTTDPFPSGVESLASDLNGELQRIRYMLQSLGGGTYWYSVPTTVYPTLTTDLLAYIPFKGETTTKAFADTIKRGVVINAVSLTSADFATSDLNTNAKFGNYSWAEGSGTLIGVVNTAPTKACISMHVRSLSASDYLAYNPLLKAWLFLDASGFVNFKMWKALAASSETAKDTATIVGATNAASNTTYQHILLNYSINAYDGAGADSAAIYLDAVSQGTALSAATLTANQGLGGYWFFGAKPDVLTLGTTAWDHFISMKVTPDAASDAWSATNATQGTVSGGILTITTASADTAYSLGSNVDLANMTAETKFKFTSSTLGTELAIIIQILDDSMNRGVRVAADIGNIYVYNKSAVGLLVFQMPLDNTQWNTFRLTSNGATNPVMNLYVNGMLVWTYTNSTSDTASTDAVVFGTLTGGTSDIVVNFEYFGYYGTTALAPLVVNGGSGQLDDIALINGNPSSAIITGLKTYAAETIYRASPAPGPYLPQPIRIGTDSVATSGYNSHTDGSGDEVAGTKLYFASDGSTPLNFTGQAFSTDSGAGPVTLALFYDGLRALQTSVGPKSTALTLCANAILPAGLHRIALKQTDGSGSATLVILNGMIHITKGNP